MKFTFCSREQLRETTTHAKLNFQWSFEQFIMVWYRTHCHWYRAYVGFGTMLQLHKMLKIRGLAPSIVKRLSLFSLFFCLVKIKKVCIKWRRRERKNLKRNSNVPEFCVFFFVIVDSHHVTLQQHCLTDHTFQMCPNASLHLNSSAEKTFQSPCKPIGWFDVCCDFF